MTIEELLFFIRLYKKNQELASLLLPIETKYNVYVVYKSKYEIVVINDLTMNSLRRIVDSAVLIYNEETKGWYEL
jgi:hypothetical protein